MVSTVINLFIDYGIVVVVIGVVVDVVIGVTSIVIGVGVIIASAIIISIAISIATIQRIFTALLFCVPLRPVGKPTEIRKIDTELDKMSVVYVYVYMSIYMYVMCINMYLRISICIYRCTQISASMLLHETYDYG